MYIYIYAVGEPELEHQPSPSMQEIYHQEVQQSFAVPNKIEDHEVFSNAVSNIMSSLHHGQQSLCERLYSFSPASVHPAAFMYGNGKDDDHLQQII